MEHHIGFVTNYYLDTNFIILHFLNGDYLKIYTDEISGTPFERIKKNTITGIWHPGIYIGQTENNIQIFAHNHFKVGRPSVATRAQFEQGKLLYPYNRICNVPKENRIRITLEQIIEGKPYDVLSYNCQHFVNISCLKEKKSDSINNAIAGLGILAGVFLLAGVITAATKVN
jgi:hypothetical protein